jgi:hypothetical protein
MTDRKRIQRLHDAAVRLGARCAHARDTASKSEREPIARIDSYHLGPGPGGGEFTFGPSSGVNNGGKEETDNSPRTPLSPSDTPFVAKDYKRFTAPVGDGQCVALVRATTGAPNHAQWQQGLSLADRPDIPDGTAIATFFDGAYPSWNTGNHAAIFMGYMTQNGQPGIQVYDQYVWKNPPPGSGPIKPPRESFIPFRDGTGPAIHDASRYSVIK